MNCKSPGGKKAGYIYYRCDKCKVYYNEDGIESSLIDYILDLVEYDFNVKKYFYPLLSEKKDDEDKQIDDEINDLKAQKARLKKAYTKGILEMDDFAEDYNVVENKLAILEAKKLEKVDLSKETFNPAHLLAQRDIEKVKLEEGQIYKDVLLKLWNMKSKDEKQEFISKFIDNATLIKKDDGSYEIDKVNFRSQFVEQVDKLYEKGVVDIPTTMEKDGKKENIRMSINLNENQTQEYIDKIKKELDVNSLDLGSYNFNGKEFDDEDGIKNEIAEYRNKMIEVRMKKSERPIRIIAVKHFENYLAEPKGKVHFTLVNHITESKKHKGKK